MTHHYTPVPYGIKNDPGVPAWMLRKRIDIPDEVLEGAIERHPGAFKVLTIPHHKEDGLR